MEQTDNRSSFRTQESVFKQFRHSCLGKIVIAGAILVVFLILAAVTNPSKEKMVAETKDNIRQSIESDLGRDADWIDVTVSNVGYTFSSADGPENKERKKQFYDESCNKVDESMVSDNIFFSTISIINRSMMEPTVCGFGIFGMVIPTVNFNNFLLLDGKIGDKPGKKIENGVNPDEYMGENPELGPFRNMYGE